MRQKTLFTSSLIFLLIISLSNTDVFGHGGSPGVDRAPAINFKNKNVTVEVKMNPSDMSVGDFSNSFMTIAFIDDDTNSLFKQVTYKVDIFKKGSLLARNMFYTEDGIVTIDIRPNEFCNKNPIWKCST